MSMVVTAALAILSGSFCVSDGIHAPSPTGVVVPDLEVLYQRGKTYVEFRDAATKRRQAWNDNYANAHVPGALLTRVRSIPGVWRLLVVAEDWCSDSANTIPYVAKLAENVTNLDLRIIDSKKGRPIMKAHRTPDGRAATPTIILLTEGYDEAGCWIERPTTLQGWFLENEPTLDEETLLERKHAWYDEDKGQETLEEIVRMIEGAVSGEPICGR